MLSYLSGLVCHMVILQFPSDYYYRSSSIALPADVLLIVMFCAWWFFDFHRLCVYLYFSLISHTLAKVFVYVVCVNAKSFIKI